MKPGSKAASWRAGSIASVTVSLTALSLPAHATILPPNNLHLEDNPYEMANITEAEFNAIINDIVELYQPLARVHGATLKSNNGWNDSTVNASANQSGNTWFINMYGGLARRREVTADGFAMVVCHELGHHFGGFPFKASIFSSTWAANEGQSDYFATQACARKAWADEPTANRRFREEVDPIAKRKCDSAWDNESDQNLCYRTAMAGKSLGTLLAVLNNQGAPDFSRTDSNRVNRTNDNHPAAQCRLDTYLAGALCTKTFDDQIIPGKRLNDRNGREAEAEAYKYSCPASASATTSRPNCWFRARENVFAGL